MGVVRMEQEETKVVEEVNFVAPIASASKFKKEDLGVIS
jgi:hypothetical protein